AKEVIFHGPQRKPDRARTRNSKATGILAGRREYRCISDRLVKGSSPVTSCGASMSGWSFEARRREMGTATRIGEFGGELILPGDQTYDRSRAVWNGMVDRRPAAILRCASPEDVVSGMRFGR